MNALYKKKKLLDEFEKKKNGQSYKNKDFVSFKDLNINVDKETYDWHRQLNGGGKFE